MVKCSNCGANIDGMKFCAECGTEFRRTVAENVSREEADKIVNRFAKRKCVAEIV